MRVIGGKMNSDGKLGAFVVDVQENSMASQSGIVEG